MKHILYILIISILFSSHTSYSMQQSLSNRQMCMFMCVAAGCGISLCLAYKYKNLMMNYLHYWNDEKKSNVVNLKKQNQNKDQQDQKKDNALTPDNIEKLIAKRKQETQILNKNITLHKACLQNDVQQVMQLLNDDANDINKKDIIMFEEIQNGERWFPTREETPLLTAFRLKNKEVINVLLKHEKIDVSIKDDYGATALSYACEGNDIAMVEQLLNHSTIKLDNGKPLYIACVNGYIDIVTLLLEHNKDNCMKINNVLLKVCQWIGKCAMKCNACDIIINALSKNITLQDLFNWEIFDNYPYCGILELLQKKRNPKNEAYQEKQKYIDERKKFMQIIYLLLEHPFIDLKQIDDYAEKTVFHYAAADDELLQLLLEKNKSLPNEKKCSIDAYSCYDTPLHEAVNNSNIKSVQLLVENGADLSKKCKNSDCYTAFSLACSKFFDKNSLEIYKEIIKYFLTLKQLIEDKDQLSEGLHILVYRKKNNDFIEEFLSYGADPNRKNSYGNSPLLTVAWKDLFLLNLFIDKYKGDINQQGNDQDTIFYTAYMAKIIQKPDDINYIKQLYDDEKKKFMEQELIIVAQKSLEGFLCFGGSSYKKYINEYIEKLNNFVATCISYGDIKIDEIKTAEGTLLDIAYKKAQERSTTPNYSTELLKFNEAIIHTLIPYYNNVSSDRNIDKQIAKIYKKNPYRYYVQSLEYQADVKKVISEHLENV